MKIPVEHGGDLFSCARVVARVIDKGRTINDPAIAIVDVCNLRKKLRCCLSLCLFLDLLPELFFCGVFRLSNENMRVKMGIPDIDRAHVGVFPDVLAVTLHYSARGVAASPLPEFDMSRAQNHARSKPLHIPFPGSPRRLVEIVDVKYKPALG